MVPVAPFGRRTRREPPASPPHDPLGGERVDEPSSGHRERPSVGRHRGADEQQDRMREHLRACPEAERVGADHPGAVEGEAALAERGDPHQDFEPHDGSDQHANPMERRSVVGAGRDGRREPESGERGDETGRRRHDARRPVRARRALPDVRRELECSGDQKDAGRDDVEGERGARDQESRGVLRGGKEASDHGQSIGAGQHRDGAREQERGHEPSRGLGGAGQRFVHARRVGVGRSRRYRPKARFCVVLSADARSTSRRERARSRRPTWQSPRGCARRAFA